MSRKTSLSVLGVIIFICLVLVFLFFYFYEIIEDDVYTGYKGEARINWYFASQQLLKKWDVDFDTIYSEYAYENLPENSTIFLFPDLNEFSLEVTMRMVQWVKDGGNLIICNAYHYIAAENIFMDYFNMTIEDRNDYDDEHLTVHLPGHEGSLKVLVDKDLDINYDTDEPPLLEISSGEDTYFVQFKFEEGYVSFTGSPVFMNNKFIGIHHNPHFFYYCTNVNTIRNFALYFVRNTKLNFLELVWKYGWICLVSIFIFVCLVIWRYIIRFGPFIAGDNNKRRSLLEHIHASGRFLWNNKHGIILIRAIEKSIWRRISYKNPVWNSLSEDEKIDWLHVMCGVNVKNMKEYLGIILHNTPAEYENIKIGQKDFLKIIKLLRRMQRTL
jgi:hypothetical protein